MTGSGGHPSEALGAVPQLGPHCVIMSAACSPSTTSFVHHRRGTDDPPIIRPEDATLDRVAELLPDHAPCIGDLVEVRSRRWLVEAVEEPPQQSAWRRCAGTGASASTRGARTAGFWSRTTSLETK